MRRIITSTVLFILPYTYPLVTQAQWSCFTNGNRINCFAGRREYLWAGTDGGVVRWDKSAFPSW